MTVTQRQRAEARRPGQTPLGLDPSPQTPKPSILGRPPRVAYIVSRFPKLTETFVLYEILALERLGLRVELFPLLRARKAAVHAEGAPLWKKIAERFAVSQGTVRAHPEAAPLVERAHFEPFFSWRILRAQLRCLWQQPRAYLGTLAVILRATWGSPNFLLGALAIFPKSVLVAEQVRALGVEHVHAHFANHPSTAAFIVHRLAGLPFSFTAHGADLQVDQHMLREKVAAAEFVVTISGYNREFILARCGAANRDKVIVLHCGVEVETFCPGQVAATDGARPFTIVCIGTMYPVKGHRYLIAACQQLQARHVDFRLLLVGDGHDRPALEDQVAAAGLTARVAFLGEKTRPEVVAMLRRADTLVVPSVPTAEGRREGIPVVLMEAMACGLPVVASGISGIPELVEDGHSGLLVPPATPAALAEALERLYHDSALRQRLGQAGREKVGREFNLAANAGQLARLFSRRRPE